MTVLVVIYIWYRLVVAQTETRAQAEFERQKEDFAAGGTPSQYRAAKRRAKPPKAKGSLAKRVAQPSEKSSASALAQGTAATADGGSDLLTLVIESDDESPAAGAQEDALRDEELLASDCPGVPLRQRWEDDF